MAPERLQKILAGAGIASRRASETLIAEGRVTVDGRVARLGEQVDPDTSEIAVDGRPIEGSTARIYLALHKPAGVTSTVADRHADETVLEYVPTSLAEGARLYPVGRLDRDSEGLLFLTNDGDWAEGVLHPRFGVEREYAVGLRAPLTDEQREGLDAGIDLDEGRALLAHPLRRATPIENRRLAGVVQPAPDPEIVWYRATLRQGWKRQLRRMFAAVGAPVARLVRVRIGRVWLEDLPSGRVRRLKAVEVAGVGGRRGHPGAPKGRSRGARGGGRGRGRGTGPSAGEPGEGG